MGWLLRYRLGLYLNNSIWVFPCIGIAGALFAAWALSELDRRGGDTAGVNVDSTMALLATLASSMFTFIVFVSSALLLAVQLASAQLSPRIIAFLFRDRTTKVSLTLFAFAYTFTLAVLLRVGTTVPMTMARIAAYGSLVSIVVFLYLIDHVGKSFRPSGALRSIGLQGRQVIEDVYPLHLEDRRRRVLRSARLDAAGPTRTVTSVRDGVVLAVDVSGLVAIARREGCVLDMLPQVGAFVAAGEPLFHVYGEAPGLSARHLYRAVALGQERTLEQDPTFAFRIVVDVACKALSPAINDPTTAVLAVDQLYHLLRNVGRRDLDDGLVADAAGELRLIQRRPGWEDFVHLAVTEIRMFGGESIQVARRLKAMLEGLIRTLPEQRTELLKRELEVLHRGAERLFSDPEDRALANVGDVQGVGGRADADGGPQPGTLGGGSG